MGLSPLVLLKNEVSQRTNTMQANNLALLNKQVHTQIVTQAVSLYVRE